MNAFAKSSIVAIAAYFLVARIYVWTFLNPPRTTPAKVGRLTGAALEIWAIVAICVWWQA